MAKITQTRVVGPKKCVDQWKRDRKNASSETQAKAADDRFKRCCGK